MDEPSADFRYLAERSSRVVFTCMNQGCIGHFRHFTGEQRCAEFGPDMTLARLTKRPSAKCGGRRWLMDVWRPSPERCRPDDRRTPRERPVMGWTPPDGIWCQSALLASLGEAYKVGRYHHSIG